MREFIITTQSPEGPGMPTTCCFWDSCELSFFLNFLAVFEDSEEDDDETERDGAEDENDPNNAELSA